MLFYARKAALIVGLVVIALASSASAQLIGSRLDAAQKTDLFTFFNLTEDGRAPDGAHVRATFKTSAKSPFRPLMRVELQLTGNDAVSAAQVALSREFINSKNGVFARDLAKSFLKAALTDAQMSAHAGLFDAIRRPGSKAPAGPDAAAYAVFLGKSRAATITLDNGELSFVNQAGPDGKPELLIRVGPRPDTSAHDALFLKAADLPGMRHTQYSQNQGADSKDTAYSANGGTAGGMSVWVGKNDDAVWRLVDIRWQFPTEAAARAYHQAAERANSEGQPAVKGAPQVGSECKVFGGTSTHPALGVEITHYYYVFRVGKTVAKIYVAQGPGAKSGALTAAHVAAIAKKAASRMSK